VARALVAKSRMARLVTRNRRFLNASSGAVSDAEDTSEAPRGRALFHKPPE
jgi:hypothetical protein